MGFQKDGLTQDAFLGGRVSLWQPASGYRAGIDPVLLAAAVIAHPGESVLDLGCGAGAAMLCLGARVNGLSLTGIERQRDYADLARRNARDTGIEARVLEADLAQLPQDVKAESFDHVIMNPPYYPQTGRSPSPDAGREVALAEETPLASWIDSATRRLKPRGYLWAIQSAERLPDLLKALDGRLGSVVAKPLCPREGRAARLVLLAARKGGRGAFRLAAPLVLHEGSEHRQDGDSYRPEAQAILRDGAHLPLW